MALRKGCILATMTQTLEQMRSSSFTQAVRNIRRGIERECLRVDQSGKIAQTDHPKALGASLTHPYITTDYSEALLELITPPSNDIDQTFAQLQDIHRFVVNHIDDELLWPMSMPCFIANEDDIRIAQYGSSNVAQMKQTYRKGLKNRYGSMMQAIAGIHYNFSLPEEFWKLLHEQRNSGLSLGEFQSESYMHLVRNVKRFVWVVTYLFGASPAMCKSFLQGRETEFGFEEFGKGSAFLPNATSLRMSDLGYTNSAQSALNIQYGSLTQYIERLRNAIRTESTEYQAIGVKVDGEYKQLNHNILQIENELYAPVRPKQVAKSGEKPTDALENRGVLYVELRALDVNPFSPYGITKEQMRVLDLFLLYCLFNEETELTHEQQEEAETNQDKVVLNGRVHDLTLTHNGEEVCKTAWLKTIFADFVEIAKWLDEHYGGQEYQVALENAAIAVEDPSKTLSGQLLDKILNEQRDNGHIGMDLARQYAEHIRSTPSSQYDDAMLEQEAIESINKQAEIEQSDTVSFDQFLENYFGK
jgi:glutamate--cysteine ligase